MLPSIIVAAPPFRIPELPPPPNGSIGELTELVRQQSELLKEQNHYLRMLVAYNDASPKWKAILARWQEEFPDIGQDCKRIIPTVERAYFNLLREVNEKLSDVDDNELENEFTMGEFLDRYNTRLAQLSGILQHLNPLADNAPPPPPAPAE
jgi:hypothetical protein